MDDGTADDENDDNNVHRTENEDLTRLNTVTVADRHHMKNGDQSQVINVQQQQQQHGNSNSSSSNSNRPGDSVTITVPPCAPKYEELQRQPLLIRKQGTNPGLFQKLYNSTKYSPAHAYGIRRVDEEEDNEFTPINKEQSNIKITPTKCLPNKTKQKPNDEEELRPLSNGYVVQNS